MRLIESQDGRSLSRQYFSFLFRDPPPLPPLPSSLTRGRPRPPPLPPLCLVEGIFCGFSIFGFSSGCSLSVGALGREMFTSSIFFRFASDVEEVGRFLPVEGPTLVSPEFSSPPPPRRPQEVPGTPPSSGSSISGATGRKSRASSSAPSSSSDEQNAAMGSPGNRKVGVDLLVILASLRYYIKH